MRYYTADVQIGGDRNHVVTKRGMPAPELSVLMAIHGSIAVNNVRLEPNTGIDKTPTQDIIDHLTKRYGRARIGDGDERRLVLLSVYPTWPNVPSFPDSAKAAGIPETQMKGGTPADKALEAEVRARVEAEMRAKAEEAAAAEEAAEFARQAKTEADDTDTGAEEAPEVEDTRSELKKLKDDALEAGATPEEVKLCGKSKVKLTTLIAEKQSADDSGADNGHNDEDDNSFME